MQTAVKVRQKLEDLAIKEHIAVQYFEDNQNEQYTLPDGAVVVYYAKSEIFTLNNIVVSLDSVVARIHRTLTRQTAPMEA